ncbi:MAG: DUF1533 domain-containing protein [Eubacteriales bacterium]|nr:DUF1533 domain-containing protein [Eubacteriales bacterium]
MKRKHLMRRAAAPVLAAACVFSQTGAVFAAAGSVTGPASYASGTWQQDEAGWRYVNAQGVMSTGWIHTASGWYYLDPSTGLMKTGWFQDTDGKWYYFETAAEGVEGRLHSGWLQAADGSWYFLNTLHDGNFGARLTGLQWINGSCYYLSEADGADQGKMLKSTTLPDGQQVDEEGRLLDENGAVRHDQQGLPATEQVITSSASGSGSGSGGGSSSGGNHSGGNSDSDGNSGDNQSGNNGGGSSGGNSGDGGSGNNGGGSDSGSGNDGGSDGGDAEKASLIDETQSVYQTVDSLGRWLPIVFDEGYNKDNTIITVDGEQVNGYVTDVTTDGSIAKLALLSKPKTLTVTAADDSSKSETVELGGAGADAVYEGADGYLPEKILTHGPVATWDYYLTNYDDDGNVRISPKRTTFNLGEEVVQHPSYAPDAEVDKDGNATVTIMFNYNTDEEKAWFDGITGYELVDYDERKDSINDHLEGESQANVSHGSGKVGQITIKAPQDNFRNNGRYYVRVKSSAGSAALVPIHLVNEKAPEFKVSDSVQSGKNLHFAVENMVYGIETPIERVTLEDPTGDVRELRYIDDWFLFSQDLFVLYNDVKAEDGRNNLQYNGNYTMTVYSNGFKTVSVKFNVSDGIDAPSKARSAVSFYDGISTASTGGGSTGGSGSGSTGGLAISANLIFDSDLLVNALLLDQIDMANDASEAVLEWWDNVIKDALFEVGGAYLDWTDYMNEVNNTLVESGSWLPYAEYADAGKAYAYPPATAKEVLEDGLLGDIQENGDYAKVEAPEHTIEQNENGKDLVIRFKDGAEYVEKIYEIYKDGTTWTGIDKKSYGVSTDGTDGILTISKDQFKAGEEHTLSIRATGYRPCAFKFTYAIVQEENLSIKVNYPAGKDAFTAVKTEIGNKDLYVADTSFAIENSEGGFLSGLTSVVLDETDNVDIQGAEGSDAAYYVISADKTQIEVHYVKEGAHTLSLRSKGYPNPLKVTFTVVNAEEEETPELVTPGIAGFSYKAGQFTKANVYRVTFNGVSGEALTKYIDAINAVQVGDTGYSRGSGLMWYETSKWACEVTDDTGSVSAYDCLDLTTDGFSNTEDTVVIIEAEGYETVTFTVDKDKNLKGDGSGLLAVPSVESTEYVEERYSDPAYYRLTFEDSEAGVSYLTNLSKQDSAYATVNGTSYEKRGILSTSTKQGFKVTSSYDGMNPGYRYVDLTVDAFNKETNEVVIYVDGYKPLTVQVTKAGAEEPDVPGTGEIAPKVTKAEYNAERDYIYYKYPAYYSLTFEATDEALTETYLSEKVNLVTVNGEEYAKSASLQNASYAFRPSDDNYGNFRYLYLTTEAFTKEVNEVVIEADGYETQTVYITKDGKLTDEGSEEETLKAPPVKEPTAKKDSYDGSYSLTFGMGNDDWVKNVNGLSVNGEAYTEGYGYSSDTEYRISNVTDGVIKFGNGAVTEDVNEIVISAEGYEDLTLYITKDGELTEGSGEEETVQAPPTAKEPIYKPSYLSGNYWEVGFDAKAKEIDAYLAAVNFTLKVDGDDYTKADSFYGSLSAREYTTGIGAYGTVLKIAAEGLDLGTHEVVITADGYEDLTFTIKVTKSTAAADVLAELEEDLDSTLAVPEKEATTDDTAVPEKNDTAADDAGKNEAEDEAAGQSDETEQSDKAELPEKEETNADDQDANASDDEKADDADDETVTDKAEEDNSDEALEEESDPEDADDEASVEKQEDAVEDETAEEENASEAEEEDSADDGADVSEAEAEAVTEA